MRSSVRVALMGTLRLERAGEAIALPTSAQRLLALVALRHRPTSRLALAGTLWPESSEQRAAASLRSALWRLQRTAGAVIDARPRELALAPGVEVDVHRVTAVAQAALDPCRPLGRDVIEELCDSDDLLPDWYEDWVELERERFRLLRVRALERACERLTAEGRFDDALETGLAAVRADPLRETARRALVELHLAAGNQSEALRQVAIWERLAARTLGVGPSEELRALVRR